MRISTRSWFLAALLFVLPRVTAAQALVPPEASRVELSAMWWKPEHAITISSGDLSSPIDFVGDLGIQQERFREIRVMLKPGLKHKLRFSYIPLEYAREGQVLQRSITFRGTTYAANIPVNTSLKWKYYRIGYEWDIVSVRRAFIGVVADLKYNKLDAQLASPLGTEGTKQNVPVPTIGGIARVYLSDYISVTGELTGFKINRSEDDFRGKLFDLDVFGQLNFTRTFAAQVGYRRITIDYLVDDDEGDLELKGIYFGGVVRF